MKDKIPWELVDKQIQSWENAYRDNNERGARYIRFALAGDQWEQNVISSRSGQNKESLTFNHCRNSLRQGKRQLKEIDFSINIMPANEEVQQDTAQSMAFRLLSESIVLGKGIMTNNDLAADKMMEYGYSFLEVSFEEENANTLNQVPITRFHKDPSIAGWDLNASHPCKIDGDFCYLKKKLTKRELLRKYPKLKKSKSLEINKKENIVVDYWFREHEPYEYILLSTGSYKRIDLLTADDKKNRMSDEEARAHETANNFPPNSLELIREGYVSKIYFKRFLNKEVIEEERLYPTNDLPLVYHPGLTFWHPEFGDFTSPFIENLEGAQKLHNYIQSQIATQAKNCSGDKWIFGKQHLISAQQRKNARDINKIEGGLEFGGDTNAIRREPSAQISESLIATAQLTMTQIDELSGARADTQNPQQQVLSGKAIDKLTHTQDSLNVDIEKAHILFVDTVSKLIGQMIPSLVTEERTIIAKNKDGSGKLIVINQLLPTGEIKNNVKDIFSNFSNEIVGSPSSAMENENTVRYLSQIYQISPQFFEVTKDIYMRSLKSKDAGELERRAVATIDPNLISYSQGSINQSQFQEAQQKQQQQQFQQKLQQQMQMSQLDPNAQNARALAEAHHRKASVAEQDAITKRLQVLTRMQHEQDKLKVSYVDLMIQARGQHNDHALGVLQQQMALNDQLIQSYRELIGDMQPQQIDQPSQNGGAPNGAATPG